MQSYLCDLYVVSVFCSYLYSDKEAAERLSKTVDEACLLLAEYNGRLAAELEDRRQLARMLVEYTQNQKEVLSEKEKKLEVSTLQGRSDCLNCPPPSQSHVIPGSTFLSSENKRDRSIHPVAIITRASIEVKVNFFYVQERKIHIVKTGAS